MTEPLDLDVLEWETLERLEFEALKSELRATRAERDHLDGEAYKWASRAGEARAAACQIVLRGATNADYERSQQDFWKMVVRAERAEALAAERLTWLGDAKKHWVTWLDRAERAEATIARVEATLCRKTPCGCCVDARAALRGDQ